MPKPLISAELNLFGVDLRNILSEWVVKTYGDTVKVKKVNFYCGNCEALTNSVEITLYLDIQEIEVTE